MGFFQKSKTDSKNWDLQQLMKTVDRLNEELQSTIKENERLKDKLQVKKFRISYKEPQPSSFQYQPYPLSALSIPPTPEKFIVEHYKSGRWNFQAALSTEAEAKAVIAKLKAFPKEIA